MYSNPVHYDTDLYQRLVNKAGQLNQKITISNQNKERLAQCDMYLDVFAKSLKETNIAIKELQSLKKQVVSYLTERKHKGNMAVNTALMSARSVVPDSMSGIHLTMQNGEAWLESDNGMLVERMEGGGFRATCSLFMRRVALSASPNTMQILILDELLAKLSPQSSAIVSTYLPILAQDMQIIIIEQKKEVYAEANCKVYNFFLADGSTIVREEG